MYWCRLQTKGTDDLSLKEEESKTWTTEAQDLEGEKEAEEEEQQADCDATDAKTQPVCWKLRFKSIF